MVFVDRHIIGFRSVGSLSRRLRGAPTLTRKGIRRKRLNGSDDFRASPCLPRPRSGIHGDNGSPAEAGFDTFFDVREPFVAGEIGWV
jgi:hypothetical protein